MNRGGRNQRWVVRRQAELADEVDEAEHVARDGVAQVQARTEAFDVVAGRRHHFQLGAVGALVAARGLAATVERRLRWRRGLGGGLFFRRRLCRVRLTGCGCRVLGHFALTRRCRRRSFGLLAPLAPLHRFRLLDDLDEGRVPARQRLFVDVKHLTNLLDAPWHAVALARVKQAVGIQPLAVVATKHVVLRRRLVQVLRVLDNHPREAVLVRHLLQLPENENERPPARVR